MKPAPSYNDVTRVHLSLFRLIGFLPRLENRITWRTGLIGFFHFAMIFYDAMHLGYEIRLVLSNSMSLECVFEGVVIHGLSIRYLILQVQRKDLLELAKLCEELWQRLVDHESKIIKKSSPLIRLRTFVKNKRISRKKMVLLKRSELCTSQKIANKEDIKMVLATKKFERKIIFLRNFFFWNSFITVVFYIITALFSRLPPETPGEKGRRFLAFKHFMEVHEGPLYFVSFVMQDIVCVTVCVIVMGIETVGPFLIMMASGYMKTVNHRLQALTEITNDRSVLCDNTNMRFGRGVMNLSVPDVRACIKFHQKIIVFCQKIEEFTRGMFTIQVLGTVYNAALIGITLVQNNPDVWKYSPLLILSILQFFTCQWIPQHLVIESEGIANAAYAATLLHPEYKHEANRMLLLMILRAQKPVQLTAGGYINLCLETFKQMFVNAISFFTVLRNFNN